MAEKLEPWMAEWLRYQGDLSQVQVPERFVHPWTAAGIEFDSEVDDPDDGFIDSDEIWEAVAAAISQVLGGRNGQD